jgi:carbonic anhydrase
MFMHNLIEIRSEQQIPGLYRNSPPGLLLRYHNLNQPFLRYENAEVLIGMCMDNRNQLRIPDNFAFIIRSGGGNLRNSEFKVSFAIAVGQVRHIVLIAHNDCGMVNLASKKEQYISGMTTNGGWSAQQAEEYFCQHAPLFEIGNESDFVIQEVKRLRNRFPKVSVTPMFFRIEDKQLYLIEEE